MKEVYKSIEEYNPENKIKVLIVFDDMIANMSCNKKHHPVVTNLLIRGRKSNFFGLNHTIILQGTK